MRGTDLPAYCRPPLSRGGRENFKCSQEDHKWPGGLGRSLFHGSSLFHGKHYGDGLAGTTPQTNCGAFGEANLCLAALGLKILVVGAQSSGLAP